MITLDEIKEWLRIDIDYTGDDNLLNSLILSSQTIIKSATGVSKDFEDTLSTEDYTEISELYKMVQRVLITDLYNEKSVENKALTSLYTQLELEYRRCLNA
nr:MAG TPA: hypothetical protein [Caudoviricetes sp.]